MTIDQIQLARPDLLREAAYVAGEWLPADGSVLEVRNPSTGRVLGVVPKLTAADTESAIKKADLAFNANRQQTGKERAIVLRRWAELMIVHKEDLARILTFEQGKPLAEARGEIEYAASFLEWFSEEAKRTYGDTIPSTRRTQRIAVIKQPVGVCAAITPWNFPSAMVTRKVAPALAAGCAVLLKPAPQCPFSALALCVLAEEAGLPKGLLSVLTGDAEVIGNTLMRNDTVRKVSFTGSTAIGKMLMSSAAPTLKKLSLELGGNAPFIVFEDADLHAAIDGAMASKFRNAGQTCVCVNRFLVQDTIYDEFMAMLKARVLELKVGDGFDPSSKLGPLIDERACDKVGRLVSDAVQRGATLVVGDQSSTIGSLFYAATIVADVTQTMDISKEEVFGPVAAVQRFSTEEEAIRIANDTPYGLAAYFYTRDLNRSIRVSEALDYGIVGLNEGMVSNEVAPFGGMKESGFGKEGSHYGIDEYCHTKYVCTGNVA